jgi:hypothetical protein
MRHNGGLCLVAGEFQEFDADLGTASPSGGTRQSRALPESEDKLVGNTEDVVEPKTRPVVGHVAHDAADGRSAIIERGIPAFEDTMPF